jgi:predicted enzyme related to lactoylglutathione lyase
MADNSIRLAFIKLNVKPMEPALAFWRQAFGFEVRQTYDEPTFFENILSLPGQDGGLSLMLVEPKEDLDLSVGHAHGPVGLTCSDIVTTLESALAAGGEKTMEITEVAPGVRVCLLLSPQGHEIELVQAGG